MSAYPGAIAVLRTLQNLPGLTYNADDLTTFYAEDKSALNDEIIAIQETLGTNPQGGSASVKDRIAAAETISSGHISNTSNPHSVTKSQVGLANADNTSDVNKPISSATQTALNLKITGPSSAVDNAVPRYDTTTGKLLQASTLIVDDNGKMSIGGAAISQSLNLQIISGGGSGTATTDGLIIHDSSVGSAWDQVNPFAAITFSSADGSTVGAGGRARIGTIMVGPGGGATRLGFFTVPTTAGVYSEVLSITSTGRVGVGSKAPIRAFDVLIADVSTSPLAPGAGMTFINSDTTANNFSEFVMATHDSAGTVVDAIKIVGVYTNHAAGAVTGDLLFVLKSGGSMATRARMLSTGEFGLSTNPTASNGFLQLPGGTSIATCGISWGTDSAWFRVAAAVIGTNSDIRLTVVGKGVQIKEGTNARMGVATLVAGVAVVSNTSVTSNTRIFLTTQSLGTVTTPKAIAVTARVASTSFTITSADLTDTSIIAWQLMEPS